jgi:hypothetical protein
MDVAVEVPLTNRMATMIGKVTVSTVPYDPTQDLADCIETARQRLETCNQLTSLVDALRAQIKDILFHHAEDCEALTNQIEELKSQRNALMKDQLSVVGWIGSKGLLPEFYRWRESRKG